MLLSKTDIDGNVIETVEIEDLGIKYGEKYVVFEKKGVTIAGKFYWRRNNGEMSPFTHNGHKTISRKCADVKIVGQPFTFPNGEEGEDWTVVIGKEAFVVAEYSYNPASNRINLKLIVGWS